MQLPDGSIVGAHPNFSPAIWLSYGADHYYLFGKTDKVWHTSGMLQSKRNQHALISLRVFLRLTAMDVCCGPPTSL